MLLDAAARHGVDLAGSFMVGDRWSDVAAGRAAGCRTVLVGDSNFDRALLRLISTPPISRARRNSSPVPWRGGVESEGGAFDS